jgi:hypothetical protein
MLKKYSAIYGYLVVNLFDLETSLYRPIMDSGDAKEAEVEMLSEDTKDGLAGSLVFAKKLAEELEMEAVLPLLDRMASKIKNPYLVVDAHKDISDLRSRISDLIKNRNFLYIPPSLEQYYAHPPLFGSDVESFFPSAIDDIEDAGKCLALGQGTACVMHLMRVMEVGLKGLAKSLKIPYAPSWESYLTQIQNKIGAKHKTKGIKWKKDEKFYRDVSGDLVSVKQAWRNPVMHIDRRYSKEEAEEIFKAVKTCMRKLAVRINQDGQDVAWLSTST